MTRRLIPLALPLALVLAAGLGEGAAQGIKPSGPAAVEAPEASKGGEVKPPADAPSQSEAAAKQQEGVKVENPQAEGKPDMTPLELIAKFPDKGSLKNPYKDYKSVAQAGHKKYMGAGCNGCHGGGGGGGMCPPLTNDVWVYGSDDDTLFRLVSLGTEGLVGEGYKRTGRENVKGPMPPHGEIVKNQDDMWKIVSWIRTVYKFDPKGQPWAQQ